MKGLSSTTSIPLTVEWNIYLWNLKTCIHPWHKILGTLTSEAPHRHQSLALQWVNYDGLKKCLTLSSSVYLALIFHLRLFSSDSVLKTWKQSRPVLFLTCTWSWSQDWHMGGIFYVVTSRGWFLLSFSEDGLHSSQVIVNLIQMQSLALFSHKVLIISGFIKLLLRLFVPLVWSNFY